MPKTKEQCEQIREEMKERIIQGAIKCFAQRGYSGCKISTLAEYIGIAQGTVYSYFPSKEAIFEAIIQKSTENSHLEEILSSVSLAKAKIELLTHIMFEEIKNKTLTSYMFALNVRIVEEQTISNQFTKQYEKEPTKLLEKIVEQGQREGTVVGGNAYRLADFYWEVIHIIAMQQVIDESYQMPPEYFVNRLLLNGISENEESL